MVRFEVYVLSRALWQTRGQVLRGYDRWLTEGDDVTCEECGYVYSSSDAGCDPCEYWIEDMCAQVHSIAGKLGDRQLMDFMCDEQAMSKALRTRDDWRELLEQPLKRLEDITPDSENLCGASE